VDENTKASEPEEQAAKTSPPWEFGWLRDEDWPDPLREPYEPARDELDLRHSQVPRHRWNGWRRLTGEEDYLAACSCGWRSTETGQVSPMLRQVKDHLDAVRAVHGWGPVPRTAEELAPDEHARTVGQHQLQRERLHELSAALEDQHSRLFQALERSTDLLSVSEEQADRLVAALQRAAAAVTPESTRTEASVRRAEGLQYWADRAKEVHSHIVATTASLAAIAEEVALLNQARVTRRPSVTPGAST
jgi:hypothetical protein